MNDDDFHTVVIWLLLMIFGALLAIACEVGWLLNE